MGKVIPMPGGGADLDGLTAVPYSVLADKVFYGAGSDEPQRGLIPSANQQKYSNISWWDNNSGYFIRMEPGNYSVADENGEKPYVFVPVSKFRSDLGISADKIRAGYNIAGVQGDTWVVWTGDVSADNTKVLNGYTYWKNGVKCTGNMASFSPGTHAPESGMNGQGLYYYFPNGYYQSDGHNAWNYRTPSEVANAIGLTAEKMVQGQSCLGIWGTVPNINVRTFRATVNSTSTSLGFLSYNNRTISYPYIDVNVGFSTILHAEALYVPNTAYHSYYSRSGNYFLINYAQDYCACARMDGPNMIFGTNNVVRIPVNKRSTQYDVIVMGY